MPADLDKNQITTMIGLSSGSHPNRTQTQDPSFITKHPLSVHITAYFPWDVIIQSELNIIQLYSPDIVENYKKQYISGCMKKQTQHNQCSVIREHTYLMS